MSIIVISGTNRENSNTLHVANTVFGLYQALNIDVLLYDLRKLPAELFEPAAYAEKPESFKHVYINPLLESDGLHIIVPEYNGGFPGVVKYFIDMLPFPESFEDRPVAFTGLSAGQSGAVRPVEQLQQVFAYRYAHLFPRRVFIPSIHRVLDEAGKLNDTELTARLEKQASGFLQYTKLIKNQV